MMTCVAFLEPAQDLEILLARDARRDGREMRLAVADHEHAFELLARLAGLQLRRLDGVRCSAAGDGSSASASRTIAPLSSTTTSRTVVAWMGTATTSFRVAVVISDVHVNPGRTSGISLSSVTTTLKLVAWPRLPGHLDRAVADFGDLAREGLLRDGVDGDLRDLAQAHAGNVRLVDLDLGLDHRHVGNRQQHRPGVVHRADDDHFAFLDVAPRDDAVDRRLDP